MDQDTKNMARGTLGAAKASVATLSLRKQYELTPEQITEIQDCHFEPKMVIENYNHTPQLRANLTWAKFAKEMGFDLSTLKPVYHPGKRIFTAVEVVLEDEEPLTECCGAETYEDTDICKGCKEHT